MNINQQNYEQFFFDLVEGNLSSQQEQEVLAFAEANPELKRELDLFRSSFLDPADAVVFEGKESLKKGEERKNIILPFWRQLAPYAVAASLVLAFFLWVNKGENQNGPVQVATHTENKTTPQPLPAPQTKADTNTGKYFPGEYELKEGKPANSAKPGIKKIKGQVKKVQQNLLPQKINARVMEAPDNKAFVYDTAVVNRKDMPEKILQKIEQPVLAKADSVKPSVQVPVAVVAAHTDSIQTSRLSIKAKLEGRLENLMGYLTKPRMKIDKVTVNDKTKYILHLENEKLKLVAGL